MASSSCFYFVTLAMLAMTIYAPLTVAEEIQVGGTAGWRLPGVDEINMYSLWTSKRRFRVGDSLRFEYNKDSVGVVDKWGYYHCDTTHPHLKAVYNNGSTTINLEQPGPMYFVSGDEQHCRNGQRLSVDVMKAQQGSPAPSPSVATSASSVFSNLVLLGLISAFSIMC